MKFIEPTEVPDRVRFDKGGTSKWSDAIEAVRGGKVVVLSCAEYEEYASLNSFRANLKTSFQRKGIKIVTRLDPETRDLYVMRAEDDD